MTTRAVHRPARVVRPVTAPVTRYVKPPPALPDAKSGSGVQALIPMAGASVAMSMMMFMRGSGFAALGAVVMVVSLGAAGVFYFTQRGQGARKRRGEREGYLDELERLRDELRRDEDELRARATVLDPPASHLVSVVADPARLWERRRPDVDFLRVRLGVGALPVRPVVIREHDTFRTPDPFMLQQAEAVIRRFALTSGMPLRVDLDRAGDVSVIGDRREDVVAVARAVFAQAAAFHAPEDLTIAVVTTAERAAEWAWARWLPHALHRVGIGPSGPVPLVVTSPATLVALLADDIAERVQRAARPHRSNDTTEVARLGPRLLVLDDAHGAIAGVIPVPDRTTSLAALGITVVHLLADRLHEPEEVSRRITVDGGAVVLEDLTADPPVRVRGDVDDASLPFVTGLARVLAPLRLSADSYDDGTGSPPADFTDLLGLSDPSRIEVDDLWKPRSGRDFLRVPLGVGETGKPVVLDLKEAAQHGMGPHGLCVGATGSGKSELLRTLVLALAATHAPEQLAMVLVDYKGGATFAPFTALPHVAGLITNLSADATMVERAYQSIEGEVDRRQQLLSDADKSSDIRAYHEWRAKRGDRDEWPPLPHLLVLIDEFGELLTAKPEFVDLFLRIGRVGRSIGVHLLLSSQRVEQGKLRGLDTYLSYRIGLRTLSEMESRTVLDNPDAFHLPSLPGTGYLKVDVTHYEKFKSAYVSGPLVDGEAEAAPVTGPLVRPALEWGRVETAAPAAAPAPTRAGGGPTLMSTVVGRLAGAADRVPAIWLPPLPAAVALDRAAGGYDVTPDGVRLRAAAGDARVPVGVLDDPARQWQGPWLLDLSSGGGHLLLVGGPGSGKSTALRTITLGLAASRTPTDVGVYGIDLLGNGLRPLENLPHVGGVAGRDNRERVRRTVDEVHAMLSERERLFALYQWDTVADLRAAPDVPDRPTCIEVVLLIDGYGQLSAEFEELETKVHDLLTRSGRYGIHVVATARRWNEVRNAQQHAFANRVELRMADPSESNIDAKAAKQIPPNNPGRAITSTKLHGQFALPRLDSVPDPTGSGLAAAAATIRSAWVGPVPPEVRVLPPVLRADLLAGAAPEAGSVAFGVFEEDFTPAVLDLFGRDQHLLVLGDSGAGKTNLLRLVAADLAGRFAEDRIVFAVYDPRGGLRDAVPEELNGGYATNAIEAQKLTAAVCEELTERVENRRSGPRVVLLVDDYDVLSASGTQPLGGFVPFVASGRDIGLHVVMARRVAGASRGLFEPFTMNVRESGCLSLVMSGDRSEGLLFTGVRPTSLPVGRAQHVRPGDPVRIVQTAYLDQGGGEP
ncbi:type VII secretion protein EccCa [Saccharothrix sp. S26]|uniref:type VII secretion protein EccCa n=1 Tax=Saccharothrix sp. S26 TaxID=2907215 RepID=UPI001F23B2D7|nr:type VII secretion protein EccCa [Saccharothrix sp. S26]MCE6996885.1 type VII secretion protein EccCa [Saccharothrix sp. S26]